MQLTLRQAINMAMFFSGTIDLRYFLNGVHVTKKDGVVTVESSNGHVAFRTQDVDPIHIDGEDIDVIIPIDDVKLALKIPKSEDFNLKGNMLSRIEFTAIDGKFPEFDRLIDAVEKDVKLNRFSFDLSYGYLAHRALKVLHRYPTPIINFATKGGRIDITSRGLENTVIMIMPLRLGEEG